MRIVVGPEGRWSWVVDVPQADDKVVAYDGKPVIVYDDRISAALRDKTLDMRETDEGPVFHLN
jgi:hypothetical protein